MTGYLFVLAGLVLLVMYFAANKIIQKKLGSGVREVLTYSSLRGFVTALGILTVYAFMYRGVPKIEPFSLIMAVMLAGFVCGYTLVGFRILDYGSLSVYTVFLMLGGMILPYLYGVIWLDEKINAFRVIGVVLMVVSLFLPLIGTGQKETAGGRVNLRKTRIIFGLLCFLVFAFNGAVSIISKAHAVKMSDQRETIVAFVMLCALANGVISLAVLLAIRGVSAVRAKKGKAAVTTDANVESGQKGTFKASIISAFPFIALAALFDGASFFFQQLGAGALPASVMYPLMTGGAIVLTSVVGFLFFKEKPTVPALIGLAITFASTFLFLF